MTSRGEQLLAAAKTMTMSDPGGPEALARVEAALPDGWRITALVYAPRPDTWMAVAAGPIRWTGRRPDGRIVLQGVGATRPAALDDLLASLDAAAAGEPAVIEPGPVPEATEPTAAPKRQPVKKRAHATTPEPVAVVDGGAPDAAG